MMKYKNLFIDLDDTLWDTFHNNKECLEELFVDYKWDQHFASFEAFFSIYMPNNLKLWEQYRNGEINRQTLILERFAFFLRPIGLKEKDDILKINGDFLRLTGTKTKLIDGAIDLLEYLHPHYNLYILSNGFRELQNSKLGNSGLGKYIKKSILSEDAGIQKPHKEIFDFALKNTNSRRTESLMIGDSMEADIKGAHNAKIDQIWFNPKKEESILKPTFTVTSLSEIKKIL
jgi:HAD superfamily (subfamily IA) hydrolase, TIGR02254